jgi:hypothetical protein
MKKSGIGLIALLVLVVALCTSAYADAPVFSDVDASTEGGAAIYKMAEMGYVEGVGDGLFAPNDPLTRAQFVKMVNRVFQYTTPGENQFSDVSPDQWYYNDVLIAQQMGYIQGMGDGTFAPEDYVTREQVCVILHRMMNFAPLPFDQQVSDPISDWAVESVYRLLASHVVTLEENNTFRATEPITREETCVVLAGFVPDELPTIDAEVPDISQMAEEELNSRLSRVISDLEEGVIPAASTEGMKQVATSVKDNMQAYLEDRTHDYQTAAEETYALYQALPTQEQEALQQLVLQYTYADDLMLLYDFFFPAS